MPGSLWAFVFHFQGIEKDSKPMRVPTFLTTGWYDGFLDNTIEIFKAITKDVPKKLVVAHLGHVFAFTEPTTRGCGELEVGEGGKLNLLGMHLEFAKKHMGASAAGALGGGGLGGVLGTFWR